MLHRLMKLYDSLILTQKLIILVFNEQILLSKFGYSITFVTFIEMVTIFVEQLYVPYAFLMLYVSHHIFTIIIIHLLTNR